MEETFYSSRFFAKGYWFNDPNHDAKLPPAFFAELKAKGFQ